MIEASPSDKKLVLDILTASFEDNQSVNYLIPSDSKRLGRIRALMDYSYESCKLFGKVYLSDDMKGCALISFPELKKTTFRSILIEARLILKGIGLGNISKAIIREKNISSNYPTHPIYYLWFIGVNPDSQNKGVGKTLIQELIHDANHLKKPIYLETSTVKNIAWYRKFGLNVYKQLDFGYDLFLIRNEP